jgi:hypothetical protein
LFLPVTSLIPQLEIQVHDKSIPVEQTRVRNFVGKGCKALNTAASE